MTTTARRTRIDSPIGPLTLGSEDERLTLLHMEPARPLGRGHHVYADAPGEDAGDVLREAARQLEAYFAGRLRAFDLPLAPRGTPFQLRVWQALREIPYGQTLGYGELAELIGAPGAARAVGLANGRNPIGIVVPCHRVIGADGKLTGYAGGIERKRYLLELEEKVAGKAEQLSF